MTARGYRRKPSNESLSASIAWTRRARASKAARDSASPSSSTSFKTTAAGSGQPASRAVARPSISPWPRPRAPSSSRCCRWGSGWEDFRAIREGGAWGAGSWLIPNAGLVPGPQPELTASPACAKPHAQGVGSIVPLVVLYSSSILPLVLSVFSLPTPLPSRLRKHFQQVTQFVLDLRGVIDSLRNLGLDEFAKALPQAVNRHLGRAFRQTEAAGGVSLGEGFDLA